MYTTLQTKELSNALTLVKPCIPKHLKYALRSPHILLNSDCTGLTLTATDSETHIVTRIKGTSTDLGKATIPYKLFAASVAATKSPTLALQCYDKSLCVIANGRTNTILPAYDDVDTFLHSDETPLTVATIASHNLRTLIRTTAYASADIKDNGRLMFRGVLCDPHHNMLRFVATDGYRLAVNERPCTIAESFKPTHDTIIPALALRKLEKMLPKETTPITIRVSDVGIAVSFTWETTTIVLRTIEGQYVNWLQIVPSAHETRLTFGVSPFMQAIKDIMLIAKNGDNSITLCLNSESPTTLTLSARGSDESLSASCTVQCDCDGIQDVKVRVNYLYLLEALASLDTADDTAYLNLTKSKSKPLVLMALDDALNIVVIMPMEEKK